MVYLFMVLANCTVYVASPVTFSMGGFQPLKVYVYLGVEAFVGVSPGYTGMVL